LIACGIYGFSLNKIGGILEEIKMSSKHKNQILRAANNYMDKKKISEDL
jgi:hypothetical protein